jgi:hypothetical protein
VLVARRRGEDGLLDHVFPPAGETPARHDRGSRASARRFVRGNGDRVQLAHPAGVAELDRRTFDAARDAHETEPAGVIETGDARREDPSVARHHQDRSRFEYQVADGEDQAVALVDDDAGAFTLGTERIGRARFGHRLDAELDGGIRRFRRRLRPRHVGIRNAPCGKRSGKEGQRHAGSYM